VTGQPDYLVTGALGQLGRVVMAQLKERGRSAIGVDLQEMPLEDQDAIRRVIGKERPATVLHLGAITNVDGCEDDPALTDRVNGHATAWIAESCRGISARMLYVSTDFVFDGKARVPYPVDAVPNPLSAYGRSKRLGEEGVLRHDRPDFWVVRTSWVFGPGGNNFPRKILQRARSGQPLSVVTDQVGRPTMTHDLAEALIDVAELRAPGGIYHASNEGQCSWHQFAVDILQAAGMGSVPVAKITSDQLKVKAVRPAWSVLDTAKLTRLRGKALPHYRDALVRYFAIEGKESKA
jgi:dTDP-4-dehydrorhamnose reductase